MKKELDELSENMLSPEKEDSLTGSESAQLDNVTWHDFNEYQFVIKPAHLKRELNVLQLDASVVENFEILEEYKVDFPEIVIFLNNFVYYLYYLMPRDNNSFLKINTIVETLWRTPEVLATLAEYYWVMDKGPILNHFGMKLNHSRISYLYHLLLHGLKLNFHAYMNSHLALYRSRTTISDAVANDASKFSWDIFQQILVDHNNCYYLVSDIYKTWKVVQTQVPSLAKKLLTDPIDSYDFPGIPTLNLLPQIYSLYDALSEDYTFEIYRPYTWNLGLQVVYRQEWRSLGSQRGEIVRTIPLGPKQLEKVSTKIVRRTRVSRSSEDLKSTETTTETSDTTKDSSEIVNEAASSFGWHMEAGLSASFYGVEASISGGMESTAEEKSKQVNNRLSEAMQKTASKMRKETKIVVTTESETTEEMTTASEIRNPNEEIALTYVYSKLQRQYEIMTSLAEIHNVVMIAEPIPPPDEINYHWVKKHDWKIAKVLLDDSFRETLNSITHDTETTQFSIDETSLKATMDSTITALTNLTSSVTQLSLSDIGLIKETQQGYRDFVKEQFERQKQTSVHEEKRERFYGHIRENILHYCRAIWSHEDSQQRLLRYKRLNLKIPLKWDLKGTYDANLEVFTGEFTADENTVVDITDIMNPAGPIGYHGNYAIYFLKPEFAGPDTFQILDVLKLPYIYEPLGDVEPILMDPLLKKYTVENENITAAKIGNLIREEMVEYVPELRLEYAMAKGEGGTAIDALYKDDALFVRYYPEYLFRKEQVRRFVLDTNNLVVDIEAGTGTALERFKLAQRALEVQKSYQEKEILELDNQKRRELLKNDQYTGDYWPSGKKILLVGTQEVTSETKEDSK